MTATLESIVPPGNSSATVAPILRPSNFLPLSGTDSLYNSWGKSSYSPVRVDFPIGAPSDHIAMVNLAVDQINELRQLGDGWDGRHGRVPTDLASVAAVYVVHIVAVGHNARPQVFPLPDGGLQVEWHYSGNDVEVEIEADGSMHVLAIDSDQRVIVDSEAEDVHAGAVALREARVFLDKVVSLEDRER